MKYYTELYETAYYRLATTWSPATDDEKLYEKWAKEIADIACSEDECLERAYEIWRNRR